MNIVDYPATASDGKKKINKWMWPIFSVLLVFVACGTAGCADEYYAGYPGYPGYGPRYAQYGPGYGYPGYGNPGYGYPGTVAVEIGDRPYYTRGAGYYVGRDYYVWKPGHWVYYRNGRKVWVHGHYVVRRRY